MTWKKLVIILAALASGWGLYRWLHQETYANYPPPAHGPWVAFGDSLTEGFGAAESHSYPALLSLALGTPIQNLGHSGDTSRDGLNRLDQVLALHPMVVLLCFGGNDALNGAPMSELFNNLATIIDRLHRDGTFVVLIGIRSASLRDRYERHFHELAQQKHVLYVPDLLQGLAFKPVYMSDAIHPNDEGYKRFTTRLEKKLKPFLPKLKRSETASLRLD